MSLSWAGWDLDGKVYTLLVLVRRGTMEGYKERLLGKGESSALHGYKRASCMDLAMAFVPFDRTGRCLPSVED